MLMHANPSTFYMFILVNMYFALSKSRRLTVQDDRQIISHAMTWKKRKPVCYQWATLAPSNNQLKTHQKTKSFYRKATKIRFDKPGHHVHSNAVEEYGKSRTVCCIQSKANCSILRKVLKQKIICRWQKIDNFSQNII